MSNRDSHVPEAIPIVTAHIDEELITRKKYFEDQLHKQNEQLEKNWRDLENSLRDKRIKDEIDLRKEHARNLLDIDAAINEKRAQEDRQRAHEEKQYREAIARLRADYEEEIQTIKEEATAREQERRVAEWISQNPIQGHEFLTEEYSNRMNTLKDLEETARYEMYELNIQHEARMNAITQRAQQKLHVWRKLKPVLAASLLGGAIGLIASPSI